VVHLVRQDLSVAGKRAGLDGERSGLYIEQVRIVKEMRERDERNGRSGVDIRPRYMVWENVPGAFSSNKGEDFRIVLEELAKVKDKDAVIPMPEKWTNNGCIVGDGWSIAWRILDAQFWGVPQRRRRIALVADFGGESAPEILFVSQSVSGNTEPSKPKREATSSDASRGIGTDDSQCITFEPGIASREGGHIYEGVSGTLRAHAGDNQMATAYSVENHPNDSRVGINEDGIVQALTQRMGTGGGNVPMVMQSVEFVVADHPTPKVDDKGIAFTTSARDYKNQQCLFIKEKRRYIVRRLTPLECERLQGYPDGWTDIGEYIDSNGKKRQASDAARYKALGNSIALPPWKWVLKRICACYERDATMASLFDGIGGFPYLWEQLNGKGTCLWASEIEEFPIAVTKVRIGGNT
jgi:DNA (cytosine-5)-methyltransferase 1